MALVKRPTTWDQKSAIALCEALEEIAPTYGAHVALTGGCLYKSGQRKDLDVLFYRIRQQPEIDEDGLLSALCGELGVSLGPRLGWVQKAKLGARHVDIFFPHYDGPEYEPGTIHTKDGY